MIEHLRKLRDAAAALRVLRYGVGALWGASPLLTVALLGLGLAHGVAPLLQVWATKGLVDALTGATPSSLPSSLPPLPGWRCGIRSRGRRWEGTALQAGEEWSM